MDLTQLTAASPASLHDFLKLLWPPSSWTTKLKRLPRIPPAWICPLRFASESSVYRERPLGCTSTTRDWTHNGTINRADTNVVQDGLVDM